MNGITRAIHIDFHTPDGVYNFGEKFDAAEFAKTLKDANVTYINMAAQCNFGYSYFDTKVSVPYPTMKTNMFRDIIRECHDENIGVSAYINVGINNAQASLHPEWCRIGEDGSLFRGVIKDNNGITSMCYNTPYRQFLLDAIKEIVSLNPDGIFCDCMGFSRCYCSTCLKKMKEQGIDIKNDDEVLKFAFESLNSLFYDIRQVVPEDKNLLLSFPGYDRVSDLNSHLEVECLPGGFGGWSYDYMMAQTAYARSLSEKTIYMSGRFNASWGDFGGTKEKASIENDMYDALLNNIGFSVGDHMNPAGNLDKTIYKTIGEVFEKAKQFEPYICGTKHLSQIGVIKDKFEYNGNFLPDEMCGVARMLSELKYGFEIINEDFDLGKFKVVILPDNVKMTDTLKAKLKAYLKTGGHILSSGFAGYDKENNTFIMEEYSFLECFGVESATAGCYKLLDRTLGETETVWSTYSKGVKIKAKNPENILANYVKHYFDDRWDRPYFDYRWTTPHLYTYLPPEKENGFAAAVMCGNICHISFEIFSCYRRYAAVFQKNMVKGILEKMISKPIVKTERIPSTARVEVNEGDGYNLLQVKVTYPEPRGKWFRVVEEHNRLPYGAKVSVLGEFQKVYDVITKSELEFYCDGEYTQIILPEIEGYIMVRLER